MIFEDTIAAIATPIGVGGVSIIRISGKNALPIADRFFHGKVVPSQTQTHSLHYGEFVDPSSSELLDKVLLSIMRGPNSYTGLDSVEINCHGGVLNSQKILETILKSGARLAGPGEFTKIAFLNGKMDLSQVEAIADLIHAKSEGGRRASIKQFTGNLSHEITSIRQQLLQLCSLLELDLDFAEENLLDIERKKVLTQIELAEESIKKLLSTYHTGHIIREGARVSIIGKPNVGKSSLLNHLLGRQRAIVSEIPGTTRDYIEETVDIEGIPFTFVDTAGIRKSADFIENKGIELSKESLKGSDVIFVMTDGSKPLTEEDEHVIDLAKAFNKSVPLSNIFWISNKSDIAKAKAKSDWVTISAKTGEGITILKDNLKKTFLKDVGFDSPMISRIRHKEALEKSLDSLDLAKKTLYNNISFEFVSIDVKNAISALGEIIGEITGDDVLNNIFSSFCIGK